MLRIGFSEVNITPELGLRMSGMLRPPKAGGVKWPLMGRTVVFDDGESRAAIVALDLLVLLPVTVAELREAMTSSTDLEPTQVLITCNHTHRGPYTASLMDEEVNFEYIDFLRERLVEGMAEALGARRPARLKVGAIQAPGWTYNRRPVYRSDLGEQVGTQGPHWVDSFLRVEGPADHELKALVAEDMQSAILGGLVNFACHATVMGGEPVYSADYSGPLTEALAERHGGVFGFLQGASGNLWCQDRGSEDAVAARGPEYARRMGVALADKANECLAQGRYLDEPRVRVARQVLRIPQRRPTREQVELAQWYLEKAAPDLDQKAFTRRIYGHDYTFYGYSAVVQGWFCREMVGMWEWQRRVGTRELIEDVEIQVIAVGDVAFVGYPAEYFTEFGLKTKAESPFAQTFVVQLANGWHGYVPTREAFAHGGYETRFAYQSRLVPEAGDLMCDAALGLLHKLAR